MIDFGRARFELLVDGQARPDLRLVSFFASHHLGRHSTLQAEVRESELHLRLVGTEQLLGKPIQVICVGGAGSPVLFDGYVAQLRQSVEAGGIVRSRLHGLGWTAMVEQSAGARTFDQSSAQEIVKKVLQESGIEIRFDCQDKTFPWVIHQYDENDLSFIQRILDQAECYLDGSRRDLVASDKFAAPLVPLALGAAGNLTEFALEANVRNVAVAGHYHDIKQNNPVAIDSLTQPAGGAAQGEMTALAAQRSRETLGRRPGRLDLGSRSRSGQEQTERIQRESRRAHRGLVRGHGKSIEPRIRAGGQVSVTRTGRHDGTYGVIAVDHSYHEGLYDNQFAVTAAERYDFAVQPPRPIQLGLLSGVVVDNSDAKKMGRVRVRLRWQNAGEKTYWARLASGYGGKGRGMYFVPEKGDEVILGFTDGDIEQPVVLGSTWNGVEQRPATAQDSNAIKTIQTSSGNWILFKDSKDGASIQLRTAGGSCQIEMANGKPPQISITSGGKVVVTAKEDIEVEATTGNLTVKAPAGKMRMEAKEIELESATTVKVNGKAGVTVQSGAQVEVKGATVAVTGTPIRLN